MPARIEFLIDKTDRFEQVRDQIGAILLVESRKQQELAQQASKNPAQWKIRVFIERANPLDEWLDRPDPNKPLEEDCSPIVNVRFDASKVDRKASEVVERQQYDGTFHIDCFGYGVATATADGGHDPGDARASLEVQRAVRLVRNILMAGHYVTLGMRGVVGYRMVDAVEVFQPKLDDRAVENVVGARVTLAVRFEELSPQVQPKALETISIEVVRADNSELLLAHEIEFVDS